MTHRRLLVPLLLLMLAVPASGVVLITPPPDEPLQKAAELVKSHDFRGAHDLALTARAGAQRDFLAGYAAYRSEAWQEAAELLDRGGAGFPLLGDYALCYRADALYRLGRYDEARASLQTLARSFPDSILTRQADLLAADILAGQKAWQPAVAAYLAFAEKYVTGADAISALSRAASCREQAGDVNGAVALYRTIWLKYPASPLAAQASGRLDALTATGVTVPPYSREELFRRATQLAGLHRDKDALAALEAIPPGPAGDKLTPRILLKKGQLLFKVRKNREAADLLASLSATISPKDEDDRLYWLARAQDRLGKNDDALATYLTLANTLPKSGLADDALLQAAYILKGRGDRDRADALLARLISLYPQSEVRSRAIWEQGWNRYRAKDFAAAAERFKALSDIPELREKALYWQGRSLEATGATETAAVFATLYSEYPNGFYASRYVKAPETRDRVVSSPDFLQAIPLPPGFDRVKSLITFGMYDEARRELAAERKKGGKANNFVATARLYLEMGDYTTPVGLVRQEKLTTITPDNLRLWNLLYPLPYREPVTAQASRAGLPESLVYGLIRAESTFSPTIVSRAGAVGLMQLMPNTARHVAGKEKPFDPADLSKPAMNISCGVRHLKDLTVRFDNSLVLTVAAYNAGSTAVNRWRTQFGSLREDEFIESIPYGETREYVKKVLAGAEMYNRLYNLGPATLPAAAATGNTSRPAPSTEQAASCGDRFANLSTPLPAQGSPL